jgi:hypothetical protein
VTKKRKTNKAGIRFKKNKLKVEDIVTAESSGGKIDRQRQVFEGLGKNKFQQNDGSILKVWGCMVKAVNSLL